ncbi:hypothetical protein JRO89_XS03G0248500 [Xanthoceras sorbifolium]|uniref:DeSI-like protein n=1 Tax=Xanthoceras sorbifolium TaxID=99658 RepID=A0ABQ8ICT2_9ROSI|nr:hypothetical protein JRO89_XS03G0248500 [Xanthoceras sorbifolium]
MLCRMVLVPRKKKIGSVPVYLNVYDLTPINGYAYWFGLGIYHSGVQGLFCNCVLPAGLNETKVRQVRSSDRVPEVEKKKLRSQSSRFVSSSDPQLSSSPSGSATRSSRQRRCIPSSSTLAHSSSTSTLSLKL